MRALTNLIVLTTTLAIATVLVGWWTVPLIAGVWTLVAPRRAAVFYASVAGAIAWGSLLVLRARGGGAGAVAELIGQIMHVPGFTLIALTVFYPALLAGSSALVAQTINPSKERGTRNGERGK